MTTLRLSLSITQHHIDLATPCTIAITQTKTENVLDDNQQTSGSYAIWWLVLHKCTAIFGKRKKGQSQWVAVMG